MTPELVASAWPVAGSAPLRLARDFSFRSTHKFRTRRRAIPWEISLRNVKGHDSGARSELIMGNGRRFEARKQRLFPRPSPGIGVRRMIMQCRAHDDDRAAPAVTVGPEIPMASAFQPSAPEQGVFSRRDVGGLVDSWLETLVPSASNRSTSEWTLVDSVDSRHGRFDEKKLGASAAPRRPWSASARAARRSPSRAWP